MRTRIWLKTSSNTTGTAEHQLRSLSAAQEWLRKEQSTKYLGQKDAARARRGAGSSGGRVEYSYSRLGAEWGGVRRDARQLLS